MDEIVEFLQSVPSLSAVPREQLEWLVRESEIIEREPGIWSRPGDSFDYLLVILEGRLEAHVVQNGQRKPQMSTEPGALTGLIPFSRMRSSPVFTESIGKTRMLGLHKSKFHELIAHNYELTEVMVHAMVDRARLFTTNHFQNEKLMALGKLSAGVAHELNNPAAAVKRSAEDLKDVIGTFDSSLRAAAELDISEQEIEALTKILEKPLEFGTSKLPLLERKRLEDALSDWLEENSIASDCSEVFLGAGITIGDLDAIKKALSSSSFLSFLNWLAMRLQTEKAVSEIGTSAKRISELVQSVKSYTRMDQAQAMQAVDINEGIRNTLTMLEHKSRRQSIAIHDDLSNDLPLINGFPGELNQVWTNLIDNALDAMKDGGELTVKTSSLQDQIVFQVIDSGPGIAPENLERIFDPFFTTKDVGEGTGVGLDLVQKVVKSHRGTIEVISRPGHTEFSVSFPRMTGQTPERERVKG